MLEPLATLEQLEARYGPITNEDMAQAALEDASALVRAEAGLDWAGEGEVPPDVIIVVVLAAARRELVNPGGDEAERIGDYSVTHGRGVSGVWLTANERRIIRRTVGSSGLGSIELESPWQTPEVETVPVDIGGDEMPWVTLGEDEEV